VNIPIKKLKQSYYDYVFNVCKTFIHIIFDKNKKKEIILIVYLFNIIQTNDLIKIDNFNIKKVATIKSLNL